MVRLIDADALMEKYHKTTVRDSWVEINTAPTIDAVPVVRCKDCIWWGKAGCAFDTRCEEDVPKEDDFCSYGETRIVF